MFKKLILKFFFNRFFTTIANFRIKVGMTGMLNNQDFGLTIESTVIYSVDKESMILVVFSLV